MHSVTDRQTDWQTDGRQDYANSRSYCVAVRSAKTENRVCLSAEYLRRMTHVPETGDAGLMQYSVGHKKVGHFSVRGPQLCGTDETLTSDSSIFSSLFSSYWPHFTFQTLACVHRPLTFHCLLHVLRYIFLRVTVKCSFFLALALKPGEITCRCITLK